MTRVSSLSFEWYVPERVYVIHVVGKVTLDTFDEMADNVLGMLNAPERSKPVHLIFNGSQVHVEARLSVPYMQKWSEQIYYHPMTASVLTVTGMNRLYTMITNAIAQVLVFRRPKHGRAMQTLYEALRFVQSIDSSLPPANV